MWRREMDPEALPVIIVGDDLSTRALLAREVAAAGYPARTAGDGESALESMAREPTAIVFVDVRLPGAMDGARFCAAVRERYPDTEVVPVTTHESAGTVIAGFKLGACDYLIKPIGDPAEIHESLGRAAARVAQRASDRELAMRTDGQAALLDRLPTAIFLVDAGRNLHSQNRAAGQLLAAGRGLQLDSGGHLRCAHHADDAALGEALVSCCGAAAETRALVIDGDPGTPKLRVVVASLRGGLIAAGADGPLAALLVPAADRPGASAHAEILAELYDLTPAEAAFAVRVIAGERVQQACDGLGITLATGRTHLARILSKTGTARQAELMALVLTGPALLAVDEVDGNNLAPASGRSEARGGVRRR